MIFARYITDPASLAHFQEAVNHLEARHGMVAKEIKQVGDIRSGLILAAVYDTGGIDPEKVAELTAALKAPTDALQAAVDNNQP